MNELWAQSTLKNVPLDSFINANSGNCDQAKKALQNARQVIDWKHINSLQLQGVLIRCVTDSLSKASIRKWSSQLSNVATPVFRFVRKALQQQLPTAANLVRWGKSTNAACALCTGLQTNKHVLSNCKSPVALERYTLRHNHVLHIVAKWLLSLLKINQTLFVDLVSDSRFEPINEVFHTLRPDIGVVNRASQFVNTLELTICHETKMQKWKLYKINKYAN